MKIVQRMPKIQAFLNDLLDIDFNTIFKLVIMSFYQKISKKDIHSMVQMTKAEKIGDKRRTWINKISLYNE